MLSRKKYLWDAKNGGLLYNKINSISPRYWNKYGLTN